MLERRVAQIAVHADLDLHREEAGDIVDDGGAENGQDVDREERRERVQRLFCDEVVQRIALIDGVEHVENAGDESAADHRGERAAVIAEEGDNLAEPEEGQRFLMLRCFLLVHQTASSPPAMPDWIS